MAIVKIEELYLYVSEVVENSAENIQAMAFMDHSGLPFILMRHNELEAHPSVFAPLNSWWAEGRCVSPLPDIDSFPFVTYVEVHDDRPARQSPVRYLKGITDIKTITDLYAVNNTLGIL